MVRVLFILGSSLLGKFALLSFVLPLSSTFQVRRVQYPAVVKLRETRRQEVNRDGVALGINVDFELAKSFENVLLEYGLKPSPIHTLQKRGHFSVGKLEPHDILNFMKVLRLDSGEHMNEEREVRHRSVRHQLESVQTFHPGEVHGV